ncbi:MAG TPA: hypothetical protein VNV38_01110 [Stellaceae bacterium]|jgi:hypothetical protein|nr:hypothetical protein [Stellaceae bacterium]
MPNSGHPARRGGATLLAGAIVLSLVGPAAADGPAFYLGAWQIASAVVGPWADPATPDQSEMKTLVGKTLTFRPGAIDGPKQFACHNLKYKITEGGADMLFQGSLAEPHEGKPPPDPAAAAAALGFKGTSWKTLETGCGNEIDFHFLDDKTAEFGLNDYVYRIEKK